MKLSRGDNAGRQWDHDYASCSNSLADLHCRIRSWIRNACMALTQAPRAPLDVFAVYCRIARHHVRACPSRILNLRPDIEARCSGGRWCVWPRGVPKWLRFCRLSFWAAIARRLYDLGANSLSSARAVESERFQGRDSMTPGDYFLRIRPARKTGLNI